MVYVLKAIDEPADFEPMWFVYVEGERSLSPSHNDKDVATAEAIRRANAHPSKRVFILEAVGAVQLAQSPVVALAPRQRTEIKA